MSCGLLVLSRVMGPTLTRELSGLRWGNLLELQHCYWVETHVGCPSLELGPVAFQVVCRRVACMRCAGEKTLSLGGQRWEMGCCHFGSSTQCDLSTHASFQESRGLWGLQMERRLMGEYYAVFMYPSPAPPLLETASTTSIESEMASVRYQAGQTASVSPSEARVFADSGGFAGLCL